MNKSSKIRFSNQGQVPFFQSHHALIYMALPVIPKIDNSFVEYRDLNKLDVNLVNTIVQNFNIFQYYSCTCVNLKLSQLNSLMSELFESIPIVRKPIKHCKDAWMNNELIVKTRKLRDRAYREFENSYSEENRSKYYKLRNKLKHLIRKYRRRHQIKRFEESSSSKEMWKILNNSGGTDRDNSYMTNINLDDINNHFASNYSSSSTSVNFDEMQGGILGFSFSNITKVELDNALMKIKSNSVGADGFSIKFLKIIYPHISNLILHFFNYIFTTSTYPENWKISRIVPIPKKGLGNDFRPICILPAISKIIEHILKEQIIEHIKQNDLLGNVQYAYFSF